jgi:Zinc knuckle
MSLSKPVKEAVAPRADEKGQRKATFSLRTKPEELPEITHNCYMGWDDIMMALKEYCRQHFQDMESIIQDLMLITEKPAYVSYEEPILEAADLRSLDEATDPLGIHKQTVLMVYKTKLAAHMNKLDKQLLDKGSAYRVIRSMCSPQLNAILVVDPNFIAVKKTDPLALLAGI